MAALFLPLLWAACPAFDDAPPPGSYLYRPAFSLDDEPCGPAEPYVPQPGDIFLATDQALWARAGHWFAGGGGVHHSGIMFRRSDGRIGLIEAGPFNSIEVEVMDPIEHMMAHIKAGDKVWVRRRHVPLTAEQSTALTTFLERQVGKPFAVLRLLGQVTPLRSRGPLRPGLSANRTAIAIAISARNW